MEVRDGGSVGHSNTRHLCTEWYICSPSLFPALFILHLINVFHTIIDHLLLCLAELLFYGSVLFRPQWCTEWYICSPSLFPALFILYLINVFHSIFCYVWLNFSIFFFEKFSMKIEKSRMWILEWMWSRNHILSIFDFIKFSEKSIVYELTEVRLG